ncbi:ATP-dependent sacrificial sulfur transferase LarE [Aestuariimicrobium sp. T2.26MG-19.2B]|uniref:ATP-dependent sacrificial sulfur transferase LarE n=1 Tax=Aestuariimicrobium sp. T2.26MG-19.2B TaxID=3040679 RepID=UPI002477784E|nr:ATP-dependent sacrificial sulfur transferase LarE [Aestuariimicrobium sp. T2.26MG-19.2B]CAI9399948.1 Pyridinium-3,5-bisthiocarboxylic acid mononucleotide synthase [Aestuariimicrobium sp. T2.26MG-19.2B]
MSVDTDIRAVAHQLTGITKLGVAYSGGVDSATLLAIAAEALGTDRVVALLAVSASLATREREIAHRVANDLGVRVIELETDELANPDYAKNDVDRCFFCKDELFTTIDDEVVDSHGLESVAYGENADDATRPDRPGAQAATNHRVLRPLAVAGLGKQQVREIARHYGLEVADKPASPCLSSRIPHGQPVTAEKLQQIDRAETILREAGFSDCRLRHHGDLARIEVPSAEIARFADDDLRAHVERELKALGFRQVTVDLGGIRSGAFTLQLLTTRGAVHA